VSSVTSPPGVISVRFGLVSTPSSASAMYASVMKWRSMFARSRWSVGTETIALTNPGASPSVNSFTSACAHMSPVEWVR
jgi:hypothetical protein